MISLTKTKAGRFKLSMCEDYDRETTLTGWFLSRKRRQASQLSNVIIEFHAHAQSVHNSITSKHMHFLAVATLTPRAGRWVGCSREFEFLFILLRRREGRKVIKRAPRNSFMG